jgi:hypothetical protein
MGGGNTGGGGVKMDAETLAKTYADLENGFTVLCEMMGRVITNAGEFLGFQCNERGNGKALVGFGCFLAFRWRFIIHNGTGFGVLGAWCPDSGWSAIEDGGDFYEIYYRCNGGVPILMKTLEQKTGDFYGNQIPDMERLLTEIIEAFLLGEQFRA